MEYLGSQLFDLLLFFLFVVCFFYLPGKFLLTVIKIPVRFLDGLFVYTTTGLILFTLCAYTLSWANVFVLTIPIFLIMAFLGIRKSHLTKPLFSKKEVPYILSVFFLSLVFSLTMLARGIYGKTILYNYDDLAHLSYINELINHFPPQNPGFSGIPLRAYHFFYHFDVAKISNITLLSPESLHFHLFPIFTSFLWGLGAYILMYLWTKRMQAGLWGVFLSFFGGSFSFIFALQGHNVNLGIDQPASSLLNPPFAISIVLIIFILLIMRIYIESNKAAWLLPLTIAVGLISMFKVYAGIIALSGFGILLIYQLFKKRYVVIISAFGIAVLFAATFGLFIGGNQHLIFFPFWEPHEILKGLPWYGYEEKISTYSRLHVIRGIIEVELYGLRLYFLGNLGTRLIGIILFILLTVRKKINPDFFSLIIFIMLSVSILIPLFFIQTGKVFEIIQLAWYYPFFCSLFAAYGLSLFFGLNYDKRIKTLLIILLIVTTLPSAYAHFLSNISENFKKRTDLSQPYFQTMNYLNKNFTYDDTVLKLPPEEKYSIEFLRGWYKTEGTDIPALGIKRSYLNNELNEYYNLDTESRLLFIKKIIEFDINGSPSPFEIKHNFAEKGIVFIFSSYPLHNLINKILVKEVYANQNYRIYKII